MVKIVGARGRRRIDKEIRVEIGVFVGFLLYHCFMKFVVFGGSVIVEQYARRK